MAYISCDGRPSDPFVIVHHTFDMNMNLKCSLDFSFIVDLSSYEIWKYELCILLLIERFNIDI